MICCDSTEVLRLADVIPNHNLRAVRRRPDFNTWGVELQPGKPPDTLLVGEQSHDFNPPCWAFMAAHEALHSIASHYFTADDYRFFLYNICEDWRINCCLRGLFEELEPSSQATRQVILRRWETEPLKLNSPVSQMLQHLCYLNHHSRKEPILPVDSAFVADVMDMRAAFEAPENWPLIESTPDRDAKNRDTCARLIRLVLQHQPPRAVNPREIRVLIQRMGYDLTFRMSRTSHQRQFSHDQKENYQDRLPRVAGGDHLDDLPALASEAQHRREAIARCLPEGSPETLPPRDFEPVPASR